ncbi:MAG: hypothetical protein GEV06_11680 [Luteitalea sp.]|nr:hypothetical protein [Luteitalea sp.]
MARIQSYRMVLVAFMATALPSAVYAQQTMEADRLVEAAGVNIHLHYDSTLYRSQFPLIKDRLIELGVRHVRDGLIDTTWQTYYDRHNELGAAGIRGTFITAPGQAEELWIDYPARVSQSFEAYEGPNEYDMSNDPNWVQVLTATVERLGVLRDTPGLEQYPVYAPSLTSERAYAMLGDVSAHFDVSNLHNYFSGREPETDGWDANGYGSIRWNRDLAERYAAGKPVVTTETGYQDIEAALDPVPPDIAGLYMPRVLLEQLRAGIVRTFIYELVDFPRSGGYGLLDATGAPKPAFNAVKHLLNLLSDPGPSFTPQDLSYTLMGSTDEVREMAFQTRDGTHYLALWLGVPSWDPVTRQRLDPGAQSVVVSFPEVMRVRLHQWDRDGSVTIWEAPTATAFVEVQVTGALTVIELTQRGLLERLLCGLLGC